MMMSSMVAANQTENLTTAFACPPSPQIAMLARKSPCTTKKQDTGNSFNFALGGKGDKKQSTMNILSCTHVLNSLVRQKRQGHVSTLHLGGKGGGSQKAVVKFSVQWKGGGSYKAVVKFSVQWKGAAHKKRWLSFLCSGRGALHKRRQLSFVFSGSNDALQQSSLQHKP